MEKLAEFFQSVLSNLAAQVAYVLLAGLCLAVWHFVRRRVRATDRNTAELYPEPPMSRTGSLILAIPFWFVLSLIYGLCSIPAYIVPLMLIAGGVQAAQGVSDTAASPLGAQIAMTVSFAVAFGVIGWRTARSSRPLHRIARFFLDGVMLAFLCLVGMFVLGLSSVLTGGAKTPPPPMATGAAMIEVVGGLALFNLALFRIYFTDGLLAFGSSEAE